MGLDALILVFWYWVLSQPVHSPLSPSPRSSSVPLHFLPLDYHLHIWACCYFSRQSWFQLVTWFQPDILHDVLCIEVKQGDNIQPWCIPFSIWNQSVVPYKVLTVASWPAYRFLRSQVRWSGIPISLIRVSHSLLWSTQSKALTWSLKQSRCFPGISLLSLWFSECWQFDLWFLCLF